MARETKAQREERLERENQERLAELKAKWPKRLMQVLQEAQSEGMALFPSASSMGFTVRYLARRGDHVDVFLPLEVNSFEDFYDVETLEYEFQRLKEGRLEAERKANLRKNALAKLTEEERMELGL